MVQTLEFEVSVGDIFHIGETTVTVVDIENGEVTFRIDDGELHNLGLLDRGLTNGVSGLGSTPLPR
jgi:hypothetical protein